MNTPIFLGPRASGITPLKQRHGAMGHDLLPRPAMSPHEPHAVVLRGLGAERGLGPAQPTLVARTEDDFVAAVQALLAEQGGAARLQDAMALLPRDEHGHFKFYPPVQRVHQLVLVEACCAQPGFPRVDPRRIESAGLVMRRPVVDKTRPTPSWLAWQRRGEQPVGWVQLSSRAGHGVVSELDEPDASRRLPHELTGNAHIDQQLRELVRRRSASPVAYTPPSERVIPLHPLPEALCAALGRTVLLGYLPVATDEVVDSPEPTRDMPDANEVQALQDHLMHYLRWAPAKALPRAGDVIDPSWLEAMGQAPDGVGEVLGSLALSRWVQTLMQLHLEFDITSTEPEAAGLQQAFSAYHVVHLSQSAKDAAAWLREGWVTALCKAAPTWQPQQASQLVPDVLDARFRTPVVVALYTEWVIRGRPHLDSGELLTDSEAEWLVMERIRRFLAGTTLRPALDFVREAIEVLTGDATPSKTVHQPDFWGDVQYAADEAFASAAAARVRQREAAMFSGAGKRLSEPGTPQAVRCFVRLKSPEGCAPTLAWSDYSDLFTVAPWWETGTAKARVIDMPDPFDRASLRKLKPNIGFAMPGRLGNLLTPSNLAKLKDGGKPSDSGVAIDWICGFNIPIITMCALIVLNIFLQLMNIIFWWLPFVKICLPIPRKK